MIYIILLAAYFFSMSPIFASEPTKKEETNREYLRLEWIPLSDDHVLIAHEDRLYSIVKLEDHYYVVQLIDHSPTCPCDKKTSCLEKKDNLTVTQ